jgi:Sec-independent protein translocase protein TatA
MIIMLIGVFVFGSRKRRKMLKDKIAKMLRMQKRKLSRKELLPLGL